MHLEAAVRIGRFCGLTTIDECLNNIELHYLQLIPYTEINKEVKELNEEYALYLKGELILDIEKIDKENDDEEMQKSVEECEKQPQPTDEELDIF